MEGGSEAELEQAESSRGEQQGQGHLRQSAQQQRQEGQGDVRDGEGFEDREGSARILVKEIPASTIILAGQSPYFETMFSGPFQESSGRKQVDIDLEKEGTPTVSHWHCFDGSVFLLHELP